MFIAVTGCGGGGTGGVTGVGGTGGGTVSLAATLSWSPVTTNTDGSELTELAGYRVHYGTESGNYTVSVDIADPTAASAVIANLQAGTIYYFAVTAYDTSGNQSEYSNEGIKSL